MDVEQARHNMIKQQIRTWDVLDQHIVDIVTRVCRESYVPEKYQDIAFADMRIPLNEKYTMMEPKLEARILQTLNIQPNDRVLEIGTGSGYLTACLSELADFVISYDINEKLSQLAGQRLASDGHENISLRIGDAMGNLQISERFDAVVINGSVPTMDKRFHERLNIHGRLFIVIGEPPIMAALLITRVDENEWSTENLFETELPPLENAQTPSRFSL